MIQVWGLPLEQSSAPMPQEPEDPEYEAEKVAVKVVSEVNTPVRV